MSRSWFQQSERGSPFALRLILWIALNIGRLVARLCLYPITFYFLILAGEQRRASFDYLERVLERQPGILDVARHIHCFAATILDRVYLLSGHFDCLDVQVYNADILLERVAAGQGCILLGSHLGSFEVLRALGVTEKELPIKVLMYEEHNQHLTSLLMSLNPAIAETIIPLGEVDTLLKVHESLEQGYQVGILGDRVAESDKMVRCRFLGSETHFPSGPAILASAMKVPVILFFGLYRGGNRYDIHFELLTEKMTLDRKDREAGIQQWTQRYADCLESYTKEAPFNWFNFYRFWDVD